jgi:hypothetical protein
MAYFDNFKQLRDWVRKKNKAYPANPEELGIVFEDRRVTCYGYNENFNECFVFYSEYVNVFGYEFIKEKVKFIDNAIAKGWAELFLANFENLKEMAISEFRSSLDYVASLLNISDIELYEIFKDDVPFYTDADYYRWGIKHLKDSKYHYFYILLILLLDDEQVLSDASYTCTPQRDAQIQEEIYEAQKRVVNRFLYINSHHNNEIALNRLYESFKQINDSGIYEYKFVLPFNKSQKEDSYPLTGSFFIPWNKVDFFNGFFIIFHPKFPNGGVGRSGLRVDNPISRVAFNDVKSLFLSKLDPIFVDAKDGSIVRAYNHNKLNDCISLIEQKVCSSSSSPKRDSVKRNAKKELTKQEAKTMIVDAKSKFLDFLCEEQLGKYKVICCLENKINSNGSVASEYAYIFTINEDDNLVTIAFENSKDSRCTYLFYIHRDDWELATEAIYEFFSSDVVNKREGIARGFSEFKMPNNYKCHRIMHSDYTNWKFKILQ